MEAQELPTTFSEMQADQIAWSDRNFGKQPAYRPLLGMIEELCELTEAWDKKDKPQILDAVGDVGIYMLDYCGKRGWDIQEFWDHRQIMRHEVLNGWWHFTPLMRKLAHHQLKGEQNIRGGSEKHDGELRMTLCCILWQLEEVSTSCGSNFWAVISSVWATVRQRDWTKNPDTTHAVAEQQVVDANALAKSTDP